MAILDNFQSTLSSLGTKAKQKYDTAMLERKIKKYSNEIKEQFAKIGVLIYEADKNNEVIDNKQFLEYFNLIDQIEKRKKSLEKQITDLKEKSKEVKNVAESKTDASKELKKHSKLAFEDKDLVITRTEEGIKMVRFCSKCGAGNNPNVEICYKCQNKIK